MTIELAHFRDRFEQCARRHHAVCQQIGMGSHRFWKFENCPAESCVSARAALAADRLPIESAVQAAAKESEPRL